MKLDNDGLARWSREQYEKAQESRARSARTTRESVARYRRPILSRLWRVLATLLAIGCASAPRPYDGVFDLPEVSGDSVTFLPIHIENNRREAPDPHFYIIGIGTHSLGIIKGYGGKLDRLIDTRWLGPDGSFTITAHYAGGRTFVFDQSMWRPGERIVASLDDIFVPGSSWSHR